MSTLQYRRESSPPHATRTKKRKPKGTRNAGSPILISRSRFPASHVRRLYRVSAIPHFHVGDQGARNDRTDAGNRGEQILLNSANSASSAFLTRAILLIKRLPDALVGNAAAALAFGGDHLDDLAAAGDKAGIGTPSPSSASTRNSGSVKGEGVVLTTSLAAPRACATSASDAIADCRYFRAASSAISPPERGR